VLNVVVLYGRGPLASPGFVSGLAHVNSANSSWAPLFSANSYAAVNISANNSLANDTTSNRRSTPDQASASDRSTNRSRADPRPDLQLHFLSYTPAIDFGIASARAINLQAAAYEWFRPYGGQQTAAILPTLQRPRSRGYVRIRSGDPLEHPEINPRC
jgi:choline dehydrogenase-like flavoprotein